MAGRVDRLWPALFWIVCSARIAQAATGSRIRSRTSAEWHPRTRSTVCVPRDCALPDCYCAGKTGPLHLRNYQIPQMVMLTFDDAINEQVYGFYDNLLLTPSTTKRRLNPNRCPISATFYLSHNWTDYDMVRVLHEAGHEIASHSITHRLPQSWWTHASLRDWRREIAGQKRNIVGKAGVPGAEVKGMRVPFLELGGDKQFTMMSEAGLLYDSSFMTGPYDEGGAWPFTLDYPPNWKYCSNNNCPKSSFPGVWELPMNRWIGPDGKPCPMVDACQVQPVDREDALGYIWYNFNRFYRGNRAPFGIHLHAVWFEKDDSYLEALRTFLDALGEMDDVYLVSASQVVDWMRNPTPVSDIGNFLPWRKTCFSAGNRRRQPETDGQSSTTSSSPKPSTPSTTTTTTTTIKPRTVTSTNANSRTTAVVEQKKPIKRVGSVLLRAAKPQSKYSEVQKKLREFPQARPAWVLPKSRTRIGEVPYRRKESYEKKEHYQQEEPYQRKESHQRPGELAALMEVRRRNDLSSSRTSLNRERLEPLPIEQSNGRFDPMASENSRIVLTDEAKKARLPAKDERKDPREKIKVEVNVKTDRSGTLRHEKHAIPGEKQSRDDQDQASIARNEKTRIKNAYESSREEAAERTYFSPSRNGAIRLESGLLVIGSLISILKYAVFA